MKLKNILENILDEGASDILYHYISPIYLIKALKNNKLTTIAAMGSDSDYIINKKKFYYLSTTRSKSSGYKKSNAKIVLDGRKLKQRYKFAPVDYWQYSKSDKLPKKVYSGAMTSLEQEDRIITDKPSIPNAKDYILEVHIQVGYTAIDKIVENIIKICNNENIPIFLYDKTTNFYNQIKPINPKDYIYANRDDDYSTIDNTSEIITDFSIVSSFVSYKNDDLENDIQNYMEKNHNNYILQNFKDITNKYKKDTIPNSSDFELQKRLKNAISNIQSESSELVRYILDLLRRDMRKNKIVSIEDYIKFKKNL